MSLDLDGYLGIHAKALVLRDKRASQIATNLANMNTPNYKAKDIDFNEALSQAMSSTQTVATSSSSHINPQADFSAHLKYRATEHMSLDGNSVEKEHETIEFTRNAMAYKTSLSFLDSKIKSMMLALRGE